MSSNENYATSTQSPDQDLGQKLCQVRNREVSIPTKVPSGTCTCTCSIPTVLWVCYFSGPFRGKIRTRRPESGRLYKNTIMQPTSIFIWKLLLKYYIENVCYWDNEYYMYYITSYERETWSCQSPDCAATVWDSATRLRELFFLVLIGSKACF